MPHRMVNFVDRGALEHIDQRDDNVSLKEELA